MSSQDRTAEFGSLVAEAEAASAPSPAAPPTGVGGGGLSRPPSSNASADPADELRNFHQTASDVSRDIAATSALLSELTRLVRRRSLFIDDSDRVNWLVLQIKRSIQSLDSRLDDAGAVIARSKRRLGRSSQRGEEVKNLEETLRTEYKRTADGFRKVLEERSARMKDSEDRKREVVGGSGSGSGGGGADGGGTIDGELALGNKPIVYDDVPVGSDPLPGRAPGGETGSSFLQAGGGARPRRRRRLRRHNRRRKCRRDWGGGPQAGPYQRRHAGPAAAERRSGSGGRHVGRGVQQQLSAEAG